MSTSSDRWSCPECGRTVVIFASREDTRTCIAAAQLRHAAGHAAGAKVARRVGLADNKTTRGKK